MMSNVLFIDNQNDRIDDNSNRTTFDELMLLLSNCTLSEQMSLDDKIEISLVQLQILEIKNFGVEQSTKLKRKFKAELGERKARWCGLNDQLDNLVNLMVGLRCDIDQFKLRIRIAFEKKMNYLNFLLQSAKHAMSQESLKQFLSNCNRPDDRQPYSIGMRKYHFELNAISNYDLDGLSKLAKNVENELKRLGLTVDDENSFNNTNSARTTENDSCTADDQLYGPSNQLAFNSSIEEPDEQYAIKQLNKVISNIDYLKSTEDDKVNSTHQEDEASTNQELLYRDIFNQTLNIEQNSVKDASRSNRNSPEAGATDCNKVLDAGLDEFTDELPDDFFKETPCSQLSFNQTKNNKPDQLNETSETITRIGLTQEDESTADDVTQRDDQQLIINDNYELDLSIDGKNGKISSLNPSNQLDHTYQPLDFELIDNHQSSPLFTNQQQMNYQTNYVPHNLPSIIYEPFNNYVIDTNSGSNRFFTNQSSESVVKKSKNVNNKPTTKEDDEMSAADFYYKTSLSSQISFN